MVDGGSYLRVVMGEMRRKDKEEEGE